MEIERDFIFDPSLVLYLPLYKLDSASLLSRDAYGHLCSVTGAVWRPGGRYFDGNDDFLSVPNQYSLRLGDGSKGSVLVWINPATWQGGEAVIQLGDASGYYCGAYSIFCNVAAGALRFVITEALGGDYQNLNATPPTTGNYHFLASTWDGALFWIGIDGEVVNSVSQTKKAQYKNTCDLWIGKSSSENYKGFISEIWIFNRGLTPQEYKDIYLATKWRYQ